MEIRDVFRSFKIGDRSADFEDPKIATCRQAETVYRPLEQDLPSHGRLDELTHKVTRQFCIRNDALLRITRKLSVACLLDALSDIGRRLAWGEFGELLGRNLRDVNDQID